MTLVDISRSNDIAAQRDYTGWPKKVSYYQMIKKSY